MSGKLTLKRIVIETAEGERTIQWYDCGPVYDRSTGTFDDPDLLDKIKDVLHYPPGYGSCFQQMSTGSCPDDPDAIYYSGGAGAEGTPFLTEGLTSLDIAGPTIFVGGDNKGKAAGKP